MTTMACWTENIGIQNNMFDVGSGLQLPTAMNAIELAQLEMQLFHQPDDICLGYLLYTNPVHNITQNTFHLTIQEGVNAAFAGDVLECATWIFNERVVVDKSLTIRGQGMSTILDGSMMVGNGDGIHINNGVTDVTIEDMGVQNFDGLNGNADAGIYANAGNDNLTIQNVTIRDNVGGSGIYAN